MSDTVIRVENISKLYRLGEVGTGSLAHDVNRWWHKVRGKEDPYLKIGEVNDRTKSVSSVQSPESSAKKRSLTTEDTESTEGGAGRNQRADSAEFLEGHSQAGLQMDSEKLASIRSANDSRASRDQTGSDSESVIIRDIRGKKSSSSALDSRPSSLVSPKAQAPSDWVYALKDVSFEVKRGEVLGIIGRNGAGKSTLLKILSRVTTQSSGQIKVKGRIASLLEVGTGFHPELTGRENIFLNGAILGMRKAEIARKFDEIVEFSGCARYIDTPVKRYSSGMYVRLAFAVAAHLEPEILIVDEVLAVGDAEFQKKCLGKMKDVAGHGRTILFVSHNMTAVQSLCTSAVFMNHGEVGAFGKPEPLINQYLTSFGSALTKRDYRGTGSNGDSIAALLEASLLDHHGEIAVALDFHEGGFIEFTYQIFQGGHLPIPSVHFDNQRGECVMIVGEEKKNLSGEPGLYKTKVKIPGHLLNVGQYTAGLGLATQEPEIIHFFDREGLVFDVIENMEKRGIDYRNEIPGTIRPKLEWKTERIL